MKKNKFYPLAGTAVFLVDQWIKDYVEKNLKMGEKKKLAEKLELRLQPHLPSQKYDS